MRLAVLAVASGFGLAAALGGQAPVAWVLAAWAPALVAISRASAREAFGVGLGAGLVAASGSLGFLVPASVRYFGSALCGGLAVLAVAIAIAVPMGVALALGAWLGRPRGLEAMAGAVALTLAERFVPTPLPFPLGTTLVGWSGVAEGAATLSVFGLSLAAHLVAAALASGVVALGTSRGAPSTRSASATALAALAVLGVLAIAARLQGGAEAASGGPRSDDASVRVLVLGAPLGDARRVAAPIDADVSLVVAPEAAYDGVVETADAAGLARAMFGAGPPILFGVTTREDGRLHNRAILSDEDGHAASWVDKVELVPLAERTLDPATSYAASQSAAPLEVRERRSGREVRLGVTICYESLFPGRAALAARHADLLVNLSNDRWFDDPHPSEAQVLALRARALETGLTTLRVARSGPSVWIDGGGRELARVEPGERAVLELPLEHGTTVGTRLGAARDVPWLALVVALSALTRWGAAPDRAEARRSPQTRRAPGAVRRP